MKNLITLSSFLLVLMLSSCEKERITANGNIISDTRNPGTFTGVHASGSNIIHVTYGNEYKVVVRGSSNLTPYFESNITNNTLYLNYKHVNVKRNDIEVFVTMPLIRRITLSGSAKMAINGTFPMVDFIHLGISGSGDISLDGLMSAGETDIDISGSGNVDFERLASTDADVTISGSGDARIAVEHQLKASISGSGKVYYTGNPSVESHISGSGKIIKF